MGYGCDGIRAYSALLTLTAFNEMLVGTACCLFMTIVGMAVSIGMMIDLKAYLLAMMMVRYHRCCQQGEHRKHPEYYGQYTTQFFIIVFEHRGTERQSFFVLTQRHKGMKIYSGYKDNKRLKSRHKAFRDDIFVDFVKAASAALCIFRSRKNIVSLCLCVKKTLPNLNS